MTSSTDINRKSFNINFLRDIERGLKKVHATKTGAASIDSKLYQRIGVGDKVQVKATFQYGKVTSLKNGRATLRHEGKTVGNYEISDLRIV